MTRPLPASEVARLLTEIGRRTALRGGNPFRAKAYLRAAESLLALPAPLDEVISSGELQTIPGVGGAIADIIEKLSTTGTHPSLERMRRETPEGLMDIMALPGMRPERAAKLYDKLGVTSIADLEKVAKEGKLAATKGFGPAFERKVLQAVDIMRAGAGARHMHRAAALLEAAAVHIRRRHIDIKEVHIAGDLRRGCELVRELALVATLNKIEGEPYVRKRGDIAVHYTDSAREGAALLFATGSRSHLAALGKLAEDKGMHLSPSGLFKKGKCIAAKTEREISKALGLAFIEPELREGADEIALAKRKRLPKLVRQQDIRGVLHAHTDLSDGVNTLEEMAEAVRKRGYEYFGVADHSQSAHYAGGLSLEEIGIQHAAIDRLNQKQGSSFRIFKGIESDILPDGSLDYPDDILARFDFVIASVHGQFRKDREEQTARILKAVAHPRTRILGHMTGRQLLRRPGYDIHIEKVLQTCAKHNVAVEINANPWRLDLDWRWHRKALEFGCTMSINPDAHSIAEIDLTRWGVAMARKGGVPPGRVLNTKSAKELMAFFRGSLRRG
jgi:DNA polymerase (family X)